MPNLKEKILLLLLTGVALGFTYNPYKQWKIIKGTKRAWKKINEGALREKIRELYRSKLVEIKKNPDGSKTLILTNKGKLKALTYHFEKMKIKEGDWDRKWRIVIFDIPEDLRRARDALRMKLKELGFHELQKSVFIFPYECKNEIEFVIEFFGLREHVRFGILDWIDNELHLKEIFDLL